MTPAAGPSIPRAIKPRLPFRRLNLNLSLALALVALLTPLAGCADETPPAVTEEQAALDEQPAEPDAAEPGTANEAAESEAEADERRLDRAEELFDRFVRLSNEHDPALAELYDDEARIELIQSLDGARGQAVEVTGADFKALLPNILPRAGETGEQNSYSEIHYWVQGERVRIEAIRKAEPQGFSVPHVLVVGPEDGEAPLEGRWLIFEEVAITPI